MARASRDETTTRLYDVLVVGGGAVGSAAALAFARAGRTIAVLAADRLRADGRTVALMQPSLRLLERLDAFDALSPLTAPLERLTIIDDTGSLFRPPPVSFSAHEIGLDCFGRNIENAALTAGLDAAVRADERITYVSGVAADIESADDHAAVILDDGTRLGARLVVAADGRRSTLRSALGIETKDWSYPQAAVTAIFSHDRPHRETSTEFHTRTGPFTLVPLTGNRSSLVWLTTPEHAAELMAQDEAAFALAVERKAQSMLGAMRLDGPRGSVPMAGLSVARYASGRTALVGEAAHVFPPIGAQGLNLGLADVAALVEAAERSDDPGAPASLDVYDAGRRSDVMPRTTAVDALNRSLLTAFLPLDFARGAGLLALGAVAPLRRMIMRRGLGA